MAITKIHAIKSTVGKSVEYICNPHKTDNRILVDTFCCGIETAELDFSRESNMINDRGTPNPAYHLIQSFAPGEVTFEEAHRIGQELASKVLDDSHCYVLATHIDRDHVHNHIIFSYINFNTLKRYNSCKSSYRNIRQISDRLCKEHGLSVIIPGEEKGKKYNEWQADRRNNSYKWILKRDIFDCIRGARSYEDFLQKLHAKGYEIKGFELGDGAPKYISFKPADYGNFIRGSHKNLGKGYTKEEIIDCIEKQIRSREEWIQKQKNLPLSNRNLIDTSGARFQGNAGLTRWAELTNLKIAANTYASVDSLSELEEKLRLLQEKYNHNRAEMVAIDKEKHVLSEQIRYMEIYLETEPYNVEYLQSKKPEQYLMQNESNLLLFEGAKSFLKESGLTPSHDSLEELKRKLSALDSDRATLKTENDTLSSRIKESKKQKDTLEKYFKKDHSNQKETDKQKKKKKGRE